MACGSVIQNESALSRDLGSIKLNRSELSSPSKSEINGRLIGPSTTSIYRGNDVHEAIRFLQDKHEKVLSGLHKQIENLQKKCDDLQFDAHLRHVTSSVEETGRKKLKVLSENLQEKDRLIQELQEKLETQNREKEERIQQQKWKELQLTQQIEVHGQKSLVYRTEISRLKSQVHDLQVYCSGVRSGDTDPTESKSSNRKNQTPRQSIHLPSSNENFQTSQESLTDSFGPRSLGSENGESETFRESRLSFVSKMFINKSKSRVQSTPARHSTNFNNNSTNFHQTISLPPVTPRDSQSRPTSGSVILPPISHSQAITRPQIRRQLRLSSAPHFDSNSNFKVKHPP